MGLRYGTPPAKTIRNFPSTAMVILQINHKHLHFRDVNELVHTTKFPGEAGALFVKLELEEITSSAQPDQRLESGAQCDADMVKASQLHLAL